MHRRTRRVAIALAGALVALGPVASVAQAASPTPVASITGGACRDDSGVTVVVDATAFGDGVHVRCAPQPVRSGFEALARAGFTYQGTVRFPGLLCRIDGEPASDPCHGAPPPDAYWAYWHAPRGGSWTYSTSGAGSRVPPPGSVEGWAFGDHARPSVPPPPPSAPTTTQPPATTSSSPTTPSTTSGGGAPASGSVDGTTTTVGEDPSGPTSPDGLATSDEPDRDVGTATADPDLARDEVASAPDGGGAAAGVGGSPKGAITGVGLIAAVAGAAVVTARRRRGAEADPP